MTELFLRYQDSNEEQLIDISKIDINLTYANADLDKLTGSNTKGSYSFEADIPATLENKKFFYFPELVLEESFDDELELLARLEVDGTIILDGYARIKTVISNGSIVSYKIVLHEGNSSWISNIKDATIKDLNTASGLRTSDGWLDNFNHVYDRNVMKAAETITDDSFYSYPLINFGKPINGDNQWSVEDRIPAFRVQKIFKEILKQAGYNVNSDFIDGDFFKSLWFTPEKLPERPKTEIIPHKFNVASGDIVYLTNDGDDRYLNQPVILPYTEFTPEPYINTGDSYVTTGSFSPLTGSKFLCDFKGRMSFHWEYNIQSLATGVLSKAEKKCQIKFNHARGFDYNVAIGAQNTIIASVVDNGGVARITTIDSNTIENGELIRITGLNSYYNGIWRVTKIAATTYELQSSVYQAATPSGASAIQVRQDDKVIYSETQEVYAPNSGTSTSGQFLRSTFITSKGIDMEVGDKAWFTITLLESTTTNHFISVSGRFYNTVYQVFTEGSNLSVKDVIPDWSQKEFIQDIRTAFNLYFYTDEIAKEVIIEPRDDFYTATANDWSDKIDVSKAIKMTHLGSRLGKTIRFRYAKDSNDKYIELKQDQLKDSDAWLSYEYTNTNKSAKDTTTEKALKLFAPTYMGAGIATAPDARIPIIWDTDVDQQPDTRIKKWKSRLLYHSGNVYERGGLTNLPSGQYWNFEGTQNQYYPAFVTNYRQFGALEHDNSLDWDNEDFNNGLFDRFYLNSLNTINTSRKFEMYLNLNSIDILNLDFRVPIYLSIEGDGAYYHLEKVIDYRPDMRGSVKCSMIKVVNPVPRTKVLQEETNFVENEIDNTSNNPIVETDNLVMTKKVWVQTDANPSGEWVDEYTNVESNELTGGLQIKDRIKSVITNV